MLDLFSRRKHSKHFMHKNTLKSYEEMRETLSKRKALILDSVISAGPGTDRQIMDRVMLSEPNMVRPSITALVQMGMIVEIGTTKCHVTGKKVRVVDLPEHD